MNLTKFVFLYVTCLVVFLVVDLLWLYWMVGSFYRQRLDHLLAQNPMFLPAFLFYLLFVLGNVVFVVQPSLSSVSPTSVFLRGALYGLVTYGTYDLTNHATMTDWPLSVTVVDMIWGMVLSSVVGYAGFAMAPQFPGS